MIHNGLDIRIGEPQPDDPAWLRPLGFTVETYNKDGRWLGVSFHRTRAEAEARAALLRKSGKYVRA